jgi:hypothetical protein
MNCKECQIEIDSAEIHALLSQQSRLHMDKCLSCSTFFKERQSLKGLIGSLPVVTAPPDFEFRLRSKISQRSRQSIGSTWLRLPSSSIALTTAAATFLLVIGIGGSVVRHKFYNNVDNMSATEMVEFQTTKAEDTYQPSTSSNQSVAQTIVNPGSNAMVKRSKITKIINSNSKIFKGETLLNALKQDKVWLAHPLPSTEKGVFGFTKNNQLFLNDKENEKLNLPRLNGTLLLKDSNPTAPELSIDTLTFSSKEVINFFNVQ